MGELGFFFPRLCIWLRLKISAWWSFLCGFGNTLSILWRACADFEERERLAIDAGVVIFCFEDAQNKRQLLGCSKSEPLTEPIIKTFFSTERSSMLRK